jgi:hypothetical protein
MHAMAEGREDAARRTATVCEDGIEGGNMRGKEDETQ